MLGKSRERAPVAELEQHVGRRLLRLARNPERIAGRVDALLLHPARLLLDALDVLLVLRRIAVA